MDFKTLAESSREIGATRSRRAKIDRIQELLLQSQAEEVGLVASYLSGKLPGGRPGIGWKLAKQAVEGLPSSGSSLDLTEIQSRLDKIAFCRGSGSQRERSAQLRELFSFLTPVERDFVLRLLVGEIRQGALEALVLEAVAVAARMPLAEVRRANMFADGISQVAQVALSEGAKGLARFQIQVFRPIAPMLASPAGNEAEALDRLGEALWEYKVDGARIQVHKSGDEIRVFTRHLKEVTDRLPEIVELVSDLPVSEAILEGEVVALASDQRPQPFQVTMRRFGRKLEVDRMRREIPLTPFFFDSLLVQGESLVERTLSERLECLGDIVPSRNRVPFLLTGDLDEAQRFLRESLQQGHEGVMVKGLDRTYVAGQRGHHWLKIKPAKTLDLVILAAEWGHGRRRGWLSNIHLGARDPESNQFVMLGKTFKGLTDRMLEWMTSRLLQLETHRDSYTVFVKPELVVEIAYSDLQKSRRYPGGVALRFARVKSFRGDKSAAEADTIHQVYSLFASGNTSE